MSTLLAGGLLLGVLVFVHELGHFLVAKATGVKVLTFSLGFGPRLFGFRRGDTDYRVSALPLGGYVRMYGDDATEDVPVEEQGKSFLHKPYLQKSAIAIAGPLANFLLPIAMFAVVFAGSETIGDAVVGTVFPDEPAAVAGVRPGDRIVAVDGQPASTFADVQKRIEASPGRPVQLSVRRGDEELALTVTPRAQANPSPLADGPVGRVGITGLVELPVVAVVDGSPAHAAGLRTQDKVTHVDGAPVATRAELFAALDADPTRPLTLTVEAPPATKKDDGATNEGDAPGAKPAPRTITLPPADLAWRPAAGADERVAVTQDELPALHALIERNRAATNAAGEAAARRRGVETVDGLVVALEEGTPAARALAKGDRIVAVDGRMLTYWAQLESALGEAPDGVHVVGVHGPKGTRQIAFRLEESARTKMSGMKVFGAGIGQAYGPGATITRDVGVGEAIARGAAATWQMGEDTLKGFALLLTGKVPLSNLGGPITIFNLAGYAAEQGVDVYVRMMALISVNLGILNLLPVPVLDGGHLMIFTIEAIRRKKLAMKTRERFAKAGLLFVLVLMVVAIGNDILRLF